MKKILLLLLISLLLSGCTQGEYVCVEGKSSKVIAETSSIHKDFVFTGAVWSTREVIVQRQDGTRYTKTSDTLIVGDEVKEQDCSYVSSPSAKLK